MKKVTLLPFIVSFLFFSCETSKITSSWRSDDKPPVPYKRIIVLALIKNRDTSIREYMEMRLTENLNKMGFPAVSAVSIFGAKALDKMGEDEAMQKLKAVGADAIVTIVLLNEQNRNYVYRPIQNYDARTLLRDRMRGFYFPGPDSYSQSPIPGLEKRFFWETNLFDLKSLALVYTVRTETYDPVSTHTMGDEYGILIANNMVDKRVLVKTTN